MFQPAGVLGQLWCSEMQTHGASPGCWFAGFWISPRTQKVFKETPSSDPHVGSGGAGEALQELTGGRFCEPVFPIFRFFFSL